MLLTRTEAPLRSSDTMRHAEQSLLVSIFQAARTSTVSWSMSPTTAESRTNGKRFHTKSVATSLTHSLTHHLLQRFQAPQGQRVPSPGR
jgi:hypothetical protein